MLNKSAASNVAKLNKIKPSNVLEQRRAGVLCHPTSLPGPLASGDFSHQVYRFIEFLQSSHLSVWQMLPLGPVHHDRSPYQSMSIHAGNPNLISLDWLSDKGLLPEISAETLAAINTLSHSDSFRQDCLHQAYDQFLKLKDKRLKLKFNQYAKENKFWLDDYALYTSIREEQNNKPWYQWPEPLRDRDPEALEDYSVKLQYPLFREKFIQFIFHQQWSEIKHYAHQHNVFLFGDMPIFVAHDSADVWTHRHLFSLTPTGQLKTTTGVPPDYFSATGQSWGNPQYNWAEMASDSYSWWHQRIATQLELFDLIRIDHFRGFEAYWEIPADAATAMEGKWVKAPGQELLTSIQNLSASLPLVAEDLGTITEEVTELREQFSIPGMKVLQFAFDGNADNHYLPHQHEKNSVVYTGTHDNDTTLSWYQHLADTAKEQLSNYLGYDAGNDMPWPLIRSALASRSTLAIIPMQDLLGLGGEHRMNTPGTIDNNWRWRFDWQQVSDQLTTDLNQMINLYDRNN